MNGLKSRVEGLEAEREKDRETHLGEVRQIRKELEAAGSERDRARRELLDKEGELKLLMDSMRGGEEAGSQEMQQLRYEKAMLLQKASKEARDGERKVREAFAAAEGKAEAAKIQQREDNNALRVSLARRRWKGVVTFGRKGVCELGQVHLPHRPRPAVFARSDEHELVV